MLDVRIARLVARKDVKRLALLGGKALKVPEPPRFPRFTAPARREVAELLRKGAVVGLGREDPVIRRVEAVLSRYHGGRWVHTTSSGHAALHIGLLGLQVGPGDEVITTPYSWGASTSCILHSGAIPVFVDVDPLTGLMDPGKIGPAVTRRTKAILVVHMYGQPANMRAINAVARRHGLFVVEDCSHAHGATINGKLAGNFGDAAGFSCMGGKLLATAEAGYMVTPHREVFWRGAMMCQHYGRSADKGFLKEFKPYVDSLVFTYRLTPMIACLFPSQLAKLGAENRGRERNYLLLRRLLGGNRLVTFPDYPKGVRPVYYAVTMNFKAEETEIPRSLFLKALDAEGVGAEGYVPSPIYRWKRLQWKGYKGPVPFWLDQLRRAKTDYASLNLPGCEYKVAHAVDAGWNWVKYAPKAMRAIADVFEKIQDNLPALRDYARKKARERGELASVRAARRVAAVYTARARRR